VIRSLAWLLAGFLCVGSVLRIYNFWIPGLWIDEYGTWWAVTNGGWSDLVQRVTRIHCQSPFYYSLTKLSVDHLGPSPFALRLPSILAGIGVVGLAYPLGHAIFQQRHAALLTLATFSVHDRLIWYSQEARPYSLTLFCTMLSFLC
jgi:mannosyltransferase